MACCGQALKITSVLRARGLHSLASHQSCRTIGGYSGTDRGQESYGKSPHCYPLPREGSSEARLSARLCTEGPLAIQLLNRLVKFLIEVADHVIKGGVLLPLGLKVISVLNEPRVDFFTHLDCLHTPPLWMLSRCFRSVSSQAVAYATSISQTSPTVRAPFSAAPHVATPTDTDRSFRAPEAGEVIWSSMLPSVWTQPRREQGVRCFSGSARRRNLINDNCREVTNLE